MYEQLVREFTEIRKRKGISQAQAAEGVNVSQFTISRMEIGENVPKLDKFIEMAKGIGMMVVLAPFPQSFPPEKKEELIESEIDEADTTIDNAIDNWKYDETD